VNLNRYLELKRAVTARGFAEEIRWAQTVQPPESAEHFAGEAIWVILCSGMRATVARIIETRVRAAIMEGAPDGRGALAGSGFSPLVETAGEKSRLRNGKRGLMQYGLQARGEVVAVGFSWGLKS